MLFCLLILFNSSRAQSQLAPGRLHGYQCIAISVALIPWPVFPPCLFAYYYSSTLCEADLICTWQNCTLPSIWTTMLQSWAAVVVNGAIGHASLSVGSLGPSDITNHFLHVGKYMCTYLGPHDIINVHNIARMKDKHACAAIHVPLQ